MTAREVLAAAAAKVASGLRPRGFRKHGLKFVRPGDEVVSLIEFQPSRGSTADYGMFVVNYGVVIPRLYSGRDVSRPYHTDCEWRNRVSDKDGRDRNFGVHDRDSSDQLADEMMKIIETDVLPLMATKQTEADLIELWLSGKGSGLSRSKQLERLGQLLHHAGRFEEFAAVKAKLREMDVPYGFALRVLEELPVPPPK